MALKCSYCEFSREQLCIEAFAAASTAREAPVTSWHLFLSNRFYSTNSTAPKTRKVKSNAKLPQGYRQIICTGGPAG